MCSTSAFIIHTSSRYDPFPVTTPQSTQEAADSDTTIADVSPTPHGTQRESGGMVASNGPHSSVAEISLTPTGRVSGSFILNICSK